MNNYKSKQLKRVLNKISEYCEKRFSQEVCGLLGKSGGHYIAQECKNVSDNPSQEFVMDPVQFLLFKEKYNVIALYHSHIVGDEEPSDFDKLMSENSCIPFLIYSLNTKKHHLYKRLQLSHSL